MMRDHDRTVCTSDHSVIHVYHIWAGAGAVLVRVTPAPNDIYLKAVGKHDSLHHWNILSL